MIIPSRRGFLGLTAVALTATLAGCSEASAPPSPEKGPAVAKPSPVLSEEKLQTILTEVTKSLAKADSSKNVADLAPRVSGSAAEFRKATYDIIKKVPEHQATLVRPSDQLVVPLMTTSESFPRQTIALVKDVAKDGLPFFVGLEQKDAKSQFTSWGWARQFPGVTMPTVAGSGVGAELVAGDAKDLVLPPLQALSEYAEILSFGHADRDPEDLFAEDPFQKGVHKEMAEERAKINRGVAQDQVATVGERYALKKGEYIGIRTADGGAIAMGTLISARTISVRAGSIKITEDNLYTKLAGKKEFAKSMVRNFGSTVMLYIPAKGSDAQIQPIGAFKVLLSVSGS